MSEKNQQSSVENEQSFKEKLKKYVLGLLGAVFLALVVAWVLQDARFAPNDPNIRVVNDLMLPVNITIDGEYRGLVNAQGSKTFFIQSYPAHVEWMVKKEKLNNGKEIGDAFGGSLISVENDSEVHIDYAVEDQLYMFLQVVNRTGAPCRVVIDEGLSSKNDANIQVRANSKTDLGYYRWYSNSNVVFDCGVGLPYVWGKIPENLLIAGRLHGDVEVDSGKLLLILE